MNIGIIGAGHIGRALAQKFARAGHIVLLSNSRGPGTLRQEIADIGEGGHAVTADEAMQQGDVVVLAVPFGAYEDVPVGGSRGKPVVDATNYYPDRDGLIADLDEGRTGSSEMVADHLPDAWVVKAFNNIDSDHLREAGKPAGDDDRIALPVCSDHGVAKQAVMRLIDEIGFDIVNGGSLPDGRHQQPGTAVYAADLSAGELREELAA